MTRKYTNKMHELLEDGIINASDLAKSLMNYMSESEVEDFATSEGYIDDEDGEE